METKKKLMKISLKGRMLAVAWWLYSDSEMMSPAKNAPNESESPKLDV